MESCKRKIIALLHDFPSTFPLLPSTKMHVPVSSGVESQSDSRTVPRLTVHKIAVVTVRVPWHLLLNSTVSRLLRQSRVAAFSAQLHAAVVPGAAHLAQPAIHVASRPLSLLSLAAPRPAVDSSPPPCAELPGGPGTQCMLCCLESRGDPQLFRIRSLEHNYRHHPRLQIRFGNVADFPRFRCRSPAAISQTAGNTFRARTGPPLSMNPCSPQSLGCKANVL